MREIKSRQNQILLEYSKLATTKARNKMGLYLVEGEKMFEDAVAFSVQIDSVFAREDYYHRNISLLSKFDSKLFVVSNIAFDKLSDTSTSQGIVLAVKMQKKEFDYAKNILVLDNISDSGNMGGLIRSAAAFGYEQIMTIGGASPYSQKSVRSSMSGIFKVNIQDCDAELALETLRKNGYQIFTADFGGNAPERERVQEKFALVLGNESQGISNEFRLASNKIITIPMQNDIQSLNVCVAGSIIMNSLNKNI